MADLDLGKPKPYTLHLANAFLSTTKQKLDLARFPKELDNIDDYDWSQGAKVKEVQRLAEYWRDGYNWRAREVSASLQRFAVGCSQNAK